MSNDSKRYRSPRLSETERFKDDSAFLEALDNYTLSIMYSEFRAWPRRGDLYVADLTDLMFHWLDKRKLKHSFTFVQMNRAVLEYVKSMNPVPESGATQKYIALKAIQEFYDDVKNGYQNHQRVERPEIDTGISKPYVTSLTQ